MFNFEGFKKTCKLRGIKICDVCARLGVARTYFNDVMRNETVVPERIINELCGILEVTPSFLTGEGQGESVPSAVRLPVLGNIAAGIPLEQIIDTFADDWEEISAATAKSGTYFALRINGDSMSPRILKGDVVIVRQQEDVENGETAIVSVGGDTATCKKIKKMRDGLMLISLNTAYAPMIYTAEEVERLPVRILGKVVELRGKTI